MNAQQRATYLATVPVHCGACGAKFPGTTQLRNGLCIDCRELGRRKAWLLHARVQRLTMENALLVNAVIRMSDAAR
jgi:hypothetical protein